ncbi:hypothetical protein [Macrococcus equipercicus]|uniref:Uncharacterized protein n=1 Tax=Macrococcus equipercicus TaxID=69967 RepID=A0A9Q9BSS3_9STAP|nr:hypothetical protein [Macrococcus equipercicus]KAA1039138.1 hypothetical protein ERX35_007950 [Macrococcus equipercicus]UTH13311.1 hypothetical protein KFV11_08565 [Macrococcus equipercicus]
MKTAVINRLSVGAVIEDKKSFEEFKITSLSKHYVYYQSIRGPQISGAIPKPVFHDDYTIIREGWKKA